MRFRMYPTPEQEQTLLQHCAHARYVWNIALEQFNYGVKGRLRPWTKERSQQLTEARGEFEWLRNGSAKIQHQALRDFEQAMQQWFRGTRGKPRWRKKGHHESFCVPTVSSVHRTNKRWSSVNVPKIGQVRFRRSREVPPNVKSFRVKRDATGKWWIAFAVVPDPVAGPEDGSVVGIDRGVAVTLTLSDGSTRRAPKPRKVTRLKRKLSRAKRGSNRRARAKLRLARTTARDKNVRKDWAEKTSTEIAQRYDLIRVEDLRIQDMTRSARGTVEKPGKNVRQKSGLNRSILEQSWGLFVARLEQKARGRVEKVPAAYTSQRCSCCGHVARESRESQALFRCVACGYSDNADVNAVKNIAAGRAVTARGALQPLGGAVNRELQPNITLVESVGV